MKFDWYVKTLLALICFSGAGVTLLGCQGMQMPRQTAVRRDTSIPSGSIMAVCPRDQETIYIMRCSNCGARGGFQRPLVYKGIDVGKQFANLRNPKLIECGNCNHPITTVRHRQCGTRIRAENCQVTR